MKMKRRPSGCVSERGGIEKRGGRTELILHEGLNAGEQKTDVISQRNLCLIFTLVTF